MKLSILVCWGPDREAFWPWLCWNIHKQKGLDWSNVEVVIDAPPDTVAYMQSSDLPCGLVRLVSSAEELVPVKRNRLMRAARGEFLCWMDSDDWQSPTRLVGQIEVLDKTPRAIFTACTTLRYLDLRLMKWCELRHYRQRALPITIMGRSSELREFPFTEDRSHGTDTIWHMVLKARLPKREVLMLRPNPFFFALRHGGNMSPQIAGFRCPHPVEDLQELCGAEWGSTTAELQRLTTALDGGGEGE